VCAFCSSSLFTNSNWFTFDGDRGINDRLAASVPSSSPNSEEISLNAEETDEVLTGETTGTESLLESASLENGPVEEAKELAEVANDSDATTVSEKFLCTEEDSASHEPDGICVLHSLKTHVFSSVSIRVFLRHLTIMC